MSARRATFRGNLIQSPRSGRKTPQEPAQAHGAAVLSGVRTPRGGEEARSDLQGDQASGAATRTQLGRSDVSYRTHTVKLCECGCGAPAPIAKRTSSRTGAVKGQPQRFLPNHQHRGTGPDYLEEDRGWRTPCWIWQRHKSAKGYGRISPDRNGGEVYAHRAFYKRTHGEVPEGKHLDHLCRVRDCVNPDHLEPVSNRDNAHRGDGTKISDADVTAIRERAAGLLRGKGKGRLPYGWRGRVAAEFGVDPQVITGIVHGRYR